MHHLAALPQVRKLRNEHHQKTLGIQLDAASVSFDRQVSRWSGGWRPGASTAPGKMSSQQWRCLFCAGLIGSPVQFTSTSDKHQWMSCWSI